MPQGILRITCTEYAAYIYIYETEQRPGSLWNAVSKVHYAALITLVVYYLRVEAMVEPLSLVINLVQAK
jgi:hypothetical protein